MAKNKNTSDLDLIKKRVLEFARKNQIDIVSIILFGSLAKQDIDKLSDLDLIVAVQDETSLSDISALKQVLYKIEEDMGIRPVPTNIKGRVVRVLDRIGAQYKSVFVCTESEFINEDTGKIFKSESWLDSAILDNPLWATDIGYKNIQLSARVIYGVDLLKPCSEISPISKIKVWRNFVMYWVLNAYALIIYPFTSHATKYSLSALKWALHSSYFSLTGKATGLTEEVQYYQELFPHLKAIPRMMKLRAEYKPSLVQVFKSFKAIRLVFMHAIRNGEYPTNVQISGK